MKPIEDLLKNLARPEVLEFGLVTNRLPSVNIGGKFEPVDDEAPTTDKLLQMLVTMGGSRYVDSLSDRPVQWTTRLDGVGVIAVAAIMRKEVVQARFTVARRDPNPTAGAAKATAAAAPAQSPLAQTQGPNAGPAQQAATQAAVAAQAAAAARGSSREPVAAAHQSRPGAAAPSGAPQAFARTAQSASGPAAAPSIPPATQAMAGPTTQAMPAAKVQPSGAPPAAQPRPANAMQSQPATKAAPPAAASQPATKAAAPAANPLAGAVPPPDEWDDDDEPTVQTLSPPVQQPGADPRPKPARKPAAGAEPAATPAVAPRTERAPEPEHAKAPPAPAQPSVPPPAPAAVPKERPSDNQLRPPAAPSPMPPAVAPSVQPPERPVVAAAAQPNPIAAQRAAAAAAAAAAATSERPGAPEPRRINTPTSVDAVDVEITTSTGSAALVLDLDNETSDQTVEMAPVMVGPAAIRSVTGAMPSAMPSAIPSTAPSAGGVEPKERPQATAATGLDAFLQMALQARASDLHIIAGRPMMLRVATDLLPRTQPVPPELVERLAREVVPPRLRDLLDLDGNCDFALDHPQHGRFRVNVAKQRSGFKITMRVIPREVPTLAALGLPQAIAAATTHQQGLVLVTGPGSSGKSSTLAALVDQLNRETAHHILTVEDPIEYSHLRKRALVSQREVGTTVRSVASALRSAMREDPDAIVIGELRDPETVRLALGAAETGHLVLATMNTPSAAKTIDRLIDIFAPTEQAQIRASVATTLRMIIGQRLVPSADRTRLVAACEILPASLALCALVRDGRTFQIPSLQQRGRQHGVVRLDESLAELVRGQKVTIEVAKQYADSPPDLEALVARGASISPRKV